jgi:hypothetical protein
MYSTCSTQQPEYHHDTPLQVPTMSQTRGRLHESSVRNQANSFAPSTRLPGTYTSDDKTQPVLVVHLVYSKLPSGSSLAYFPLPSNARPMRFVKLQSFHVKVRYRSFVRVQSIVTLYFWYSSRRNARFSCFAGNRVYSTLQLIGRSL